MKDKMGLDCTAVYHPEINKAMFMVNSVDMRAYHVLISFIPLLFPNLFKDKPLDESDYKVITALNKTDSKVFIAAIKESVNPYLVEFRRIMLEQILKNIHNNKIARAKISVDNQRALIARIFDEYTNNMTLLKDLIVTYEGMKATEKYDEPELDLVEYLSDKKEIGNLSVNGDSLCFTVATKLINFDEDAWETFASKGYIFDGNYTYDGTYNISLLDAFKTRENRARLLNSIFGRNPEFEIKMVGNYKLNLYGCSVSTERNYDYPAANPAYVSYMPNPHLRFYGCLGGYEGRVAEALQDRNYIGAIEMCCMSAGSVALHETEQTFRPFIGYLMMTREKVLVRKDGVEMTPEEALVYLVDKEKDNETAKD